jgi:tetratricopeptide (TPR) repeat protein
MLGIWVMVGAFAYAQQSASGQSSNSPASTANQPSDQSSSQSQVPPNQPPPTSQQEKADRETSRDRSAEAGESSSRDTRIDTTAPKDDAKNHPNSGNSPRDNSADSDDDVQEMHPWDPYRAVKDDEVGDFYFKQKSYKAALARYQDALIYKNNDAVANFRLAQCYEKLDQPEQAIPHYQEYLKILPEGPYAKDARKALAKLGVPEKQPKKVTQ